MRYVLILTIVTAALVGGCVKTKPSPQTTAIGPEIRPLADLKPDQPPKTTSPSVRVGDVDKTRKPSTPKRKKPTTNPPTAVKNPAAPTGTKLYTIQMGDKGFYAIARKLYGDQRRWKDIEALNPGVDSTKLMIGQKIRVPVK